jgi:hypothetical protein
MVYFYNKTYTIFYYMSTSILRKICKIDVPAVLKPLRGNFKAARQFQRFSRQNRGFAQQRPGPTNRAGAGKPLAQQSESGN